MTILRSFIGLGFLMLGYYVFPMWLELAVPKFLWFILIVVDMIGAWLNGRVDLWGGRIGNVWLYYGCAITGSFLCIKICHLVAAKERRFLYAKIERFFEFIGRNTITVLATHQCCIKLLYKLTERKFYGYLDGVILFFIVIVIEVVIIQFLHRLNSFRQKCDSCNFL